MPLFKGAISHLWNNAATPEEAPLNVYTDGSHNIKTDVMGSSGIILEPGNLSYISFSKVVEFAEDEYPVENSSAIAEFYAAYLAVKESRGRKLILNTDYDPIQNLFQRGQKPKKLENYPKINEFLETILEACKKGQIVRVNITNDKNKGTKFDIRMMREANKLAAEATGTQPIKPHYNEARLSPLPKYGASPTTDGAMTLIDTATDQDDVLLPDEHDPFTNSPR